MCVFVYGGGEGLRWLARRGKGDMEMGTSIKVTLNHKTLTEEEAHLHNERKFSLVLAVTRGMCIYLCLCVCDFEFAKIEKKYMLKVIRSWVPISKGTKIKKG